MPRQRLARIGLKHTLRFNATVDAIMEKIDWKLTATHVIAIAECRKIASREAEAYYDYCIKDYEETGKLPPIYWE